MCYRPIHIYNPSRRWNCDAPLRIAVPCGFCEDCRRVMRNEWFFRSVIEYNHYKTDLGGSVYFATLTYSNENLPEIELPNGKFVSAFNKYHIRNFIKYIRIYLSRKHIMSTDIKYLVCSEYSDKNTKRPHYHVLLFFPFHLSEFEFGYLMRTCWKHGWIVCSKQGWEIKSIAGLRYASKYICKDIAFINQPWARVYLRDERFKEWKDTIKDYLPRHWQSVGFGEKFCEVISQQEDIAKFLAKNSYTLCLGYTNNFPIPRYYHLKFEKEINKSYSKMLDKVVLEQTEIGKQVKRYRLDKAIEKDMANLKVINKASLERDLPSLDDCEKYLRMFKERYPDRYNYYAYLSTRQLHADGLDYKFIRETLVNDLPKFLDNLSIFQLSTYRVFLRHFPCFEDEDPLHKFAEVTDIICNMIEGKAFPPEYKGTIEFDNFGNVFATPLADNEDLKQTPTCQGNSYFYAFEMASIYLDMVNFFRGLNKDYKAIIKSEEKQKCKDSLVQDPIYYQSLVS